MNGHGSFSLFCAFRKLTTSCSETSGGAASLLHGRRAFTTQQMKSANGLRTTARLCDIQPLQKPLMSPSPHARRWCSTFVSALLLRHVR